MKHDQAIVTCSLFFNVYSLSRLLQIYCTNVNDSKTVIIYMINTYIKESIYHIAFKGPNTFLLNRLTHTFL